MKGFDLMFLIFRVAIVLLKPPQGFCLESSESSRKVDMLRERLQTLERRLAEDITMLREEFYVEIETLAKNSDVGGKSTGSEGASHVAEISVDHFKEYFEHLYDSVEKKLRQFQLGLGEEKRIRRAFQSDLNGIKIKEFDQTTILDNILQEVKTIYSSSTEQISKGTQNISQTIAEKIKALINRTDVQEDVKTIADTLKQIRDRCHLDVEPVKTFVDCSDLRRNGHLTSGVYTVHPDTIWRPVKVYCDMETAGGGWTVFQRRKDGSEDFYRNWMDYTYGFGNLNGEFWLGNEFLHRFTAMAPQELRIELEDFDNDHRVAEFGEFSVGSAKEKFKLSVAFFSGNVSDSLISAHNEKGFSTTDYGPSTGCASQFKGGWWYGNCHAVNINGLYHKGDHKSNADGVIWHGWRGPNYSLKFTEMKFRSK